MSNSDGYFGALAPNDKTDPYNATLFQVLRILSGRFHAAPVKVVAVSGTVIDVQPMVNQLDADNNSIPHGVISNVPFFRLQAGGNAVVLAPEVDDIGIAIFADRDISAVKATRDVANPGSARQADMADAMYFGGFLNDEPVQFLEMLPGGIRIVSPDKVDLSAPVVEINAPTSCTVTTGLFKVIGPSEFEGTVTATDTIHSDVDVTGADISLVNHPHNVVGIQLGGSTKQSTPPLP